MGNKKDGEVDAIFITAEEALTLKKFIERQYINREITGIDEVINKIIKFADEQLANRTS